MDIVIIVCSIALIVLCLFDIIQKVRKRQQKEHDTATALPKPEAGESAQTLEERLRTVEAQECCGTHAVCEKEQMIRALRQRIDYFDDEELDAYRGIAAEDYTDAQIEEFREVLYTMQPKEIEDWLKSLELREVALPMVLKEEACTLIADERGRRAAQ